MIFKFSIERLSVTLNVALMPCFLHIDLINISLYDKNNYSDRMNYIDYGLSICKRDIFTRMTYNIFDLAEIFTSFNFMLDSPIRRF